MEKKIQQIETLINLIVDNKLDAGTYHGSLYVPQRYQNFLESNGIDCSLAKSFTGVEGTCWHNDTVFEFDAFVDKEQRSEIQQASFKDNYSLLDILKLLDIPYEIVMVSNSGIYGRLSLILPKSLCLSDVFKHANKVDVDPISIISKYEPFRLGKPHGSKCEVKQIRYPSGGKVWEGECQEITNFVMLLSHQLPNDKEMYSSVNISKFNRTWLPPKFEFEERD